MEFTTGALGTLLPKLVQLLQDEYNLHKGAKKDIEFLLRELESTRAALREVGNMPPEQLDELVRIWAREAREVSYDMEDIVDTFLVNVQGPDERPRKRSTKRFIKDMRDIVTKAKTRHEIHQKIKDIKERVKEVPERRDRYKVDGITPAETVVAPRIVSMHTRAVDLVGLDDSIKELIMGLTKGDDTSMQQQRIVSIVGFGGLGKTTLAKMVYENLKGQFDCTAFVSVGRNPDLKKVLKDILIDLHMHLNLQILDERQLIDNLREFLENKRYIIVIDDVWEIDSWEIIKLALIDNYKGSRIIVTTRNYEVARKTSDVYELQPLSYDNSRKLFFGRISGGESKSANDQQYDEVSDKILKKCDGIPLAIITMASLLVGKPMEEWLEVHRSIGFGNKENRQVENTMKILSFSYYDLPSHLRTCLLYLSVFPEDYVIKKDNLIWKWIAEGFVCEEPGKWLFEVGEGYFNNLINRSMIQAVEFEFDGAVHGCRVHDTVLDLIRSLSHEENFVSVVDEESQMFPLGSIRRLALHNRNEDHSLGDYLDWEHLRSLNAIGCPVYLIPPVSRFIILRVLDLESCGSMEGYDLEHLGKLLHLRFMGLRNTFVRKLPEEIGHLKFLQTLDLDGSGVEELPASMGELTQLMCLNADWTTRVPDWIVKLTSLQYLVMYPGGGDGVNSAMFVKDLENLRELRVLRFWMKAEDEGQLRYFLESVSTLHKIEKIHFACYGVQLNSGFMLESARFVLSSHIRSLELHGFHFSRLPPWINPQDLPNLRHLWLMVFDVEEHDLEILGGFPELRYLHLLIVNTQRGEIVTSGSGAFQNLKFCSITKPLKFVRGAMPRLEVLDFHFNVRLLADASHNFDFDLGLGNLHSLQQVIVQINCMAAFSEEVEKAEVAVRNGIDIHPGRPTLEISLYGQRMDADLILPTKLEKTDEPREEIIRMLSAGANDTSNKNMKILSIVRSEGLGKTTLAQEVFDELSPQFDCGAFVQVGQNADLRKVFTDILNGVDKQKYKKLPMTVLDLMELIRLLHKSLINKRFFIVVDDLWDLKAWDIIKCALIENSNGSAVLTTSCKTVVTEYIGGSMQLAPLSTTESKIFFCRKLFGSEDKCPRELEYICEKLIETCDGMLSKITDTVKQLESVPSTVKDWQAVYGGRKISYPGLPDHLKSCILYFSMFQKGHEISAERLVWQWIAEGFVQTVEDQQTLQEAGESYLSNLIMEKMIEAVEVDAGGKALSCRMHDFVHDIVIKKASEDNLVAILDGSLGSCLTDTVHHRLSIQGNTVVHSLPKAWLSRVRSLVVSGDTMPPLSDFRELRVLDLGGSLQNDHLKGIHNSHSLRYMVIGGKCITCIPKEVNFIKLKNLQTLDLRASGLNELPKRVFRLENLERLCVNSHMKIPDGIAKMASLQELGDINIVKPELLKELRKLSKLRVLRIAIWSWDDESLKNSGKQLWNNLCSLVQNGQNIHSLSILTCCSLEFMDGSNENWTPQSLRKLEIRYSSFHNKLPSWFGSLPNISSLTIEVTKLSHDIIDILGDLPTLCSLFLTSKQIPEGYFFMDSDKFRNLESLKFASNAIPQNMLAPRKATQQLKRITIVFQASRTEDINKDFSFGLENLCSLEHVRVEIFCFNASYRMLNKAEAAIREAISRDRSSHLNLEIRRLHEKSMLEEVDLR